MTTLAEALDLYGLAGVHPAADLFPMMGDEERKGLADDARANGWTSSVLVTDDGLLLDGRNRLVVSVEISLDVPVRRMRVPDPVAFVLSENLHRRHLSEGQRAMVGVAVEALRAAEAKQRQRDAADARRRDDGTLGPLPVGTNSSQQADSQQGKAAQQAATAVGVGPTAIKQAKKLTAEHPDLAQQVRAGELNLNQAVKAARRRTPQAPHPEPKPKASPVMLKLSTHDGRQIDYPQPASKPTFNPTNDHISWAAWSWNPVTGCLTGCGYCYARELAAKPSYASAYPVGFAPLFHHERLSAPVNTPIPAEAMDDPRKGRVFVGSMTDLFGEWVPQGWIDQVYEAMAAAPDWRYLCLTKHPKRYKRAGVPPRLWAGTSVDTQARVRAAEDAMRDVPAAVRWLSVEPMEERLTFRDLSWCDWVVIGSRTATVQPTGAVPAFAPPIEWVIDLVAQAREAGAAIYLKPNLLGRTDPQSPGMQLMQEMPGERIANDRMVRPLRLAIP